MNIEPGKTAPWKARLIPNPKLKRHDQFLHPRHAEAGFGRKKSGEFDLNARAETFLARTSSRKLRPWLGVKTA